MRRGIYKLKSGLAPFVAIVAAVLTFGGARVAQAQIETRPTWAVTEFENVSKKGPENLGKIAAQAISDELGKTNQYDVLPVETVVRVMADLGLQAPVKNAPDLNRLGMNLQANTVVSGQIVKWRIIPSGAGKQADVLLRMEVRDVASGLTVNGSALQCSSGVRTGDVSDETLLTQALTAGAFTAVSDMSKRSLPAATVLNTLPKEALINKGSRSGFEENQTVIIVRGREQVAQALVARVDPDSAFVRVTRQIKGVQPGDRVRVIFDVPSIKDFGAAGQPRVASRPKSRSNAGLVSLILVLAIVGLLANKSGQDMATDVKAEAVTTIAANPGVRVSWSRDSLLRGNNEGAFAWQLWRNDVAGTPVAVCDGRDSTVVDDSLGTNAPGNGRSWYDFKGVIGGTTCDNTTPPTGANPTGSVACIPGTPYNYFVEVIYRVSPLTLPGEGSSSGGTGGGGAGTGGSGTGGSGTGGSGTGGSGTGGSGTGGSGTGGSGSGGSGSGAIGAVRAGDYCYFASQKTAAGGQATPLNIPTLRSPDDAAVVNTPLKFQFTSVRGVIPTVSLQYVIQLSTDPSFPRGSKTVTLAPMIDQTSANGATLSSSTIDTSTYFTGATTVYWRVGARNVADQPGPYDPNGIGRYIYSAPRRFTRQSAPPNPPTGAR